MATSLSTSCGGIFVASPKRRRTTLRGRTRRRNEAPSGRCERRRGHGPQPQPAKERNDEHGQGIIRPRHPASLATCARRRGVVMSVPSGYPVDLDNRQLRESISRLARDMVSQPQTDDIRTPLALLQAGVAEASARASRRAQWVAISALVAGVASLALSSVAAYYASGAARATARWEENQLALLRQIYNEASATNVHLSAMERTLSEMVARTGPRSSEPKPEPKPQQSRSPAKRTIR